jgi:hypothetical protein
MSPEIAFFPLPTADGVISTGMGKVMRTLGESGGLAGTRTQDQRLKRPLLYRLSYQPGTAKEQPLFGPELAGLNRRGTRRPNHEHRGT